jgi:hypothetical protein
MKKITEINDDIIKIKEASREWIQRFDRIPTEIVWKLYNADDEIVEITPTTAAEYDSFLPMWGTMWSFESSMDNEWLDDEKNLQAMADCGFRIYMQENYGYIFGIDGAGYDFYEAHWIPLYKARGLMWHLA